MFVEKESHKGIVIGAGGGMLKQIGAAARQEIEAMSGRSVYLSLRVKVRKNWRDDDKVLRWFGY
jgi:GTP-binding protein Era